METTFRDYLSFGQIGESRIAGWFKRKGYSVLRVYEKEINSGKGPRFFTPHGKLIALDMLVINKLARKVFWIEAKHKTAFTWHRNTGEWVTGIDLKHYGDYCSLQKLSPFPVWLLFLHLGGQAKDSPAQSPAGLFGGELGYLQKHEHHRHRNWGIGGMVYWAHKTLREIANLEEVTQAAQS